MKFQNLSPHMLTHSLPPTHTHTNTHMNTPLWVCCSILLVQSVPGNRYGLKIKNNKVLKIYFICAVMCGKTRIDQIIMHYSNISLNLYRSRVCYRHDCLCESFPSSVFSPVCSCVNESHFQANENISQQALSSLG